MKLISHDGHKYLSEEEYELCPELRILDGDFLIVGYPQDCDDWGNDEKLGLHTALFIGVPVDFRFFRIPLGQDFQRVDTNLEFIAEYIQQTIGRYKELDYHLNDLLEEADFHKYKDFDADAFVEAVKQFLIYLKDNIKTELVARSK